MGKLLSRLICYGNTEQGRRRPERQSQEETIILKTTREPVVYRDSLIVKTNSEKDRDELSTAIKYFILNRNKE
jgi:tRNA(Ser,Leu) C12 N-acetylase TAN1